MRVLTAMMVASIALGSARASIADQVDRAEVSLRTAIETEAIRGDLKSAIRQYQQVADDYARTNRSVAARALLRLGDVYQKLGDAAATTIYEKLARDFGDQKDAAASARARLKAIAPRDSAGITLKAVPRSGGLPGAVSWDGRLMTFASWDDGNLYVRDLTTGADRVLTRRADFNIGVSAISRDGTAVAYQVFERGCDGRPAANAALCLVPLGGSGIPEPRVILESSEILEIAPMDWSADGRTIAVSVRRQDRTAQIGLVSIGDGVLRVLKSVDWRGPNRVFFSPDGVDLVFDVPASDETNARDIFMVAVDGSRGGAVVAHPSEDIVMGWTPDGSRLLFVSDRGGAMGLWAQPFEARRPKGEPRLIRGTLEGAWSLGITLRGALYFGVRRNDRDISIAAVDGTTGKELRQPLRPIRRFVGTNVYPEWSRDGRYLAYVSQRGFNPTNNSGRVIGVRDMADGVERELHPKLVYFGAFSWSPDGRSLITGGTDVKGRSGVYTIDSRTGDISLVVETSIGAYPQWAADGRHIFYRTGREQSGEARIIERDLTTNVERTVAAGNFPVFSVSPGGGAIAAVMRDSSSTPVQRIVLIDVVSGAIRELLPDEKNAFAAFIAPQWTPGGDGVLVRKRSPNELWLVPSTGDSPRKVELDVTPWPLGLIGKFSVHPDGQQIAFLSGSLLNEVMILENFIPAASTSTQR